MIRSVTLSALLMAGTLALGHAAAAAPLAQPTDDPALVSKTVSIRGLKMHTPAGARIALERIRSAAGEICGPQPAAVSLITNPAHGDCMQRVISSAVAGANFPVLTALYDHSTPFGIREMAKR